MNLSRLLNKVAAIISLAMVPILGLAQNDKMDSPFYSCHGTLNKEVSSPISVYDQEKGLERVSVVFDLAGFFSIRSVLTRQEIDDGRCQMLPPRVQPFAQYNDFRVMSLASSPQCSKVSDFIAIDIHEVNSRKLGQLSLVRTSGHLRHYIYSLQCR